MDLRLYALSKERQHPGINLVSFGQPSSCSGEVSRLSRIHNCYGQASSCKGCAHRLFVTTGRLRNNSLRIDLTEVLLELIDIFRVVFETTSLDLTGLMPNRQVQVVFGYVDAWATHGGVGSDD